MPKTIPFQLHFMFTMRHTSINKENMNAEKNKMVTKMRFKLERKEQLKKKIYPKMRSGPN